MAANPIDEAVRLLNEAGYHDAADAITAAQQQGQTEYTYASTQATKCAGCGEHKHTPLRIDAMGGYVCLTCIDQKLGSLLGEFGYAPSAPVGVEGLPQPFGYVEPRHDLSGYEVFDEPGPRRAAVWNMHGMRKALAQTRAHYSIDADPDGIRERVADAITGALSFGAQRAHKPPAGHWLEPFWDMARAEREAPSPPTVGEATARRLDDYLGGEFDIRIGKQAAHAALVHALAQQPAAVDRRHPYVQSKDHGGCANCGYPEWEPWHALATQHQEPKS